MSSFLTGDHFQPKLTKTSLGEFLFSNGEKYSDRICQIDADMDLSETYQSVKVRSTRLAIGLEKKGVTSKDVICFCTYNSIDNSVSVIASLYLGAKIASLDPTLSARTTKHLLTLASPRIVFVQEESVEMIENCLGEVPCEIIVYGASTKYTTFADLLQPGPNEDAFKPAKVDINDIVIMFFSSGTTGLPKAICHSHYSFLQVVEIASHSIFTADCILHFTTLYWISGMHLLIQSFLDGSTRVFARTMEGESTFKMLEKYKVTSLCAAPIYTYELNKVSNPEKYDVSSFRYFLTGGTPISNEQYKKLLQLFPQAQVFVGYGMSEIGMVSVFHAEKDKSLMPQKIGSCGKVVPRCTLKIVNPDTEEVLGPNQKGEIRVKSDGMMIGYYRLDSSDCFDDDGFLKTGDLGYYDEDKCLYLVERMKEMFKYRSWHIVPSSIEAVILEHPAVKETAVFGIPTDEEGEIPAASVVLKDNCNVDKEEIQRFVDERVSDKEKLRGGVIFVSSLPRTPSGKLIRNEARNIAIKSM